MTTGSRTRSARTTDILTGIGQRNGPRIALPSVRPNVPSSAAAIALNRWIDQTDRAIEVAIGRATVLMTAAPTADRIAPWTGIVWWIGQRIALLTLGIIGILAAMSALWNVPETGRWIGPQTVLWTARAIARWTDPAEVEPVRVHKGIPVVAIEAVVEDEIFVTIAPIPVVAAVAVVAVVDTARIPVVGITSSGIRIRVVVVAGRVNRVNRGRCRNNPSFRRNRSSTTVTWKSPRRALVFCGRPRLILLPNRAMFS